ncbi:hypothetical protein GRB70_39745 [Bradyrhizobium neotropicale]|nr:hypothetical protein [Bradyrhizobium neotropicale]
MPNPFHYRPGADQADWADTALSNAMAWGSQTFVSSWCASETHWTSRATEHVFTDCPCCLFFRGCLIGSAITMMAWAMGFVIVGAALR